MELYGIDISNHQSGIDLSKLKNTDFVIVKATQGWNWTDPSFKNLYSQALKSGKLLGTYYYAMPKNNNAKDDADYYVQEVNKIKGSSKPIFVLDWEEPPTDKVNWAYEWLERVASLTGTTPLIYMDLSRTRSHDWSKVSAKYPLWLAQYPVSSYIYDYAKGDRSYSTPKYWSKPTIWQFTSHGRITGYSGNLDCNVFYGSKEDWYKFSGQEDKNMSTSDIIKAHCNDFNVNNFVTKLNSYGGYKSYVKSLGGVFAKYADFKGKVTKASELSEVGQYVCGLLSIYGVDYATGSTGGGSGNWWKNDKPASQAGDAFYPRSEDKGGKKNYLHEKIDDVLSDTTNYEKCMVVDCETGVDMIRFKAGIYSGKESYDFRGMVQNGGKIITNMKDLQVGDIVEYYTGVTFPDKSPSKIVSTFGYMGHRNDNGGKGWFHVNVVGEVDYKNNTITTYDTGHAFTNSGEYKITVSRNVKIPYPWASDWVAVRPVKLIQDYWQGDKSVDTLAHEVLDGLWGSGDTRKAALTKAGYDYSKVQARVNEIVDGKGNKVYFKAESIGAFIRSKPVDGEKIGMVNKGEQVEITGFSEGFEKDGYQWAKVKKGNVEGWSQLDLKNAYKLVK